MELSLSMRFSATVKEHRAGYGASDMLAAEQYRAGPATKRQAQSHQTDNDNVNTVEPY